MNGEIFIYLGAALPFIWGIAHLFPTKSVVQRFGDISRDNKNIIAMEWIIEGVALIFLGVLVALVTYIDPATFISKAVYVLSSLVLIILAIVSVFTGFRVNFLPFRLCPIVFSVSAVLITIGWFIIH
jgi:hypothetical protein